MKRCRSGLVSGPLSGSWHCQLGDCCDLASVGFDPALGNDEAEQFSPGDPEHAAQVSERLCQVGQETILFLRLDHEVFVVCLDIGANLVVEALLHGACW